MEWFQAGGYGMFVMLVIGAASIGYGVNAMRDPTVKRVAVLRALPMLILTSAIFTFGTDMWAMNRYLTSEAAAKATEAAGNIGFVGLTEATQAFTLGGLLAFVVALLGVVAENRIDRRAAN